MVRSTLNYSNLLVELWMEALKMATHTLNRVPSKSVPKTSFELWTRRNPRVSYLHLWGCSVEAKLFDPLQKKLDPKTISCHFIGYLNKSKIYWFYCPSWFTMFVETRQAIFLENAGISGRFPRREISLEEIWVELTNSMIQETIPIVHKFVPQIVISFT